MKKYIVFLILILTLVIFSKRSVAAAEVSRDLKVRRMNVNVLEIQHDYNSTEKIVILKNLSAYDMEQIKLHAGRLFIRGTIIME